MSQPASVKPFKIDIQQAVLDDLRDRLSLTRWPDEPEDAAWGLGVNLEYLKDLVKDWQTKYDWRKHEAELNQLEQFTAEVDGVKVHFVHLRGKGPNPKPLLLTHGWPDTFQRFYKVIPMLTDPEKYGGKAEDSFDVIVPSIPGFGFSQRRSMTSSAVADLWAKLMTDVLGYERFAAAGGDIGSGVTKALALHHPELLTGIHLTDVEYPTGQEDFSTMSQAEQQFAGFIQGWWFQEGAYAMMHMSKPQSVAVGLNDSPAGLAAWVTSFINTGADEHDVEAAFGGRDALLTNLTIYWATQTAGSAARMYLEDARASYGQQDATKAHGRSEVPAGIALFPREAQFPREWAERSVNVQRFTKMPKGGHFAALEEPELFVDDLREFFKGLR
jgi:pimeloyl-ACP methyl ester carboxylesterase